MNSKLLEKIKYSKFNFRKKLSFWLSRKENLLEAAFDDELSESKKEEILNSLGEKSFISEMKKRELLKNAIKDSYSNNILNSSNSSSENLKREKELAWQKLRERIESSNELVERNVSPLRTDLAFTWKTFFKSGGVAVALTSAVLFFMPGLSINQEKELQSGGAGVIANNTNPGSSVVPLNTEDVSYRLNVQQYNLASSYSNFRPSKSAYLSNQSPQLISQGTLDSLSDDRTESGDNESIIRDQEQGDFNSYYLTGLGSGGAQSSSLHFVSNE